VRPRSANEWRSFWHHGGEEQLEALLKDVWTPLRDASEEACRPQAERVALLLGSAAPDRALASELGRIRIDLGAEPDPDEDTDAAGRISSWFRSQAS
jgi:hypothetical protein